MTRIIPPYLKQGSQSLLEYPEIAKFWSHLNDNSIENISSSSQRKIIWNCTNGLDHTFSRVVAKMFLTQNCPICTFRELLKGFNDLETTHPEVAKRWSPENELKASEVMQSNTKKFYWVDDYGHSYKHSVYDVVTLNKGCKYCSGQAVLAGFNDLATTAPEEVKFWDYEKNEFYTTENISKGSNKLVWWKCSKSHSVERSPKSWIKNHCDYCSGRKLLLGFNDVFTVAPHLKEEWDYEKNTLDPLTLRFNYRDKVWWKCKKCFNSWESVLRSRTQKDVGCPDCAINTSFLEEIVNNFLKENYNGIIWRQRRPIQGSNQKLELDFWLPEINLGIEVQDFTTHSRDSDTEYTDYRAYSNKQNYKKGPAYHENKRRLAKEQLDVTVLDLWEDEIRAGEESIFKILKNYLNISTPVISNKSIQKMVESRKIAFKSLDQSVNPMTFNDFNSKTKRDELYFLCQFGHSYETTMENQIKKTNPCIKCATFVQIVLHKCEIHGETKHSKGSCLECNSEKFFTLDNCSTHGETKFKAGVCYKCIMTKATTVKHCPIHGESKHRGNSCYNCRNKRT